MIDSEPRHKTLGAAPFLHPAAEVRESTFGRYCEVGARTRIVDSTLGDYSDIGDDAEVMHATLGRFVSIASTARLTAGPCFVNRPLQNRFRCHGALSGVGEGHAACLAGRRSRRLVIGHDVRIGHGATIMGDLHIGTGAVIGAGAVVTKNVPAYAVVGGAPATPIRERFPLKVQEALKRIAWWDWDHETLTAALPDFRTLGVEGFIRKYG